MPVVVALTVETDGRLPTGQSLRDAIAQVDAATKAAPAYYMINCAHPTHFDGALAVREPWVDRIHGLRANASTKSHAELNESTELDAAVLVLPLLGIEADDSPRVRSTIDAIAAALGAGGPLLYRYPPGRDGLAGGEGAFLPCSFWHVQALASTGRTDEARALLDQLVDLASPLGLYAEEIDPASGRHLGNYPQALTHSALVQAALALRDAERRRAAT